MAGSVARVPSGAEHPAAERSKVCSPGASGKGVMQISGAGWAGGGAFQQGQQCEDPQERGSPQAQGLKAAGAWRGRGRWVERGQWRRCDPPGPGGGGASAGSGRRLLWETPEAHGGAAERLGASLQTPHCGCVSPTGAPGLKPTAP